MHDACSRLGDSADLTVVDSSEYAAPGEQLSFWELMARAQKQRDVLVGYYAIPEDIDQVR